MNNDNGLAGLYEKIGDVQASIRALHEIIALRAEQADQLHDLMRLELVTLRREQGELDARIDWAVQVIDVERTQGRADRQVQSQDIRQLRDAIQNLKMSVNEMNVWRGRVVGMTALIGGTANLLIWLAEPAYRWCIDRWLTRH